MAIPVLQVDFEKLRHKAESRRQFPRPGYSSRMTLSDETCVTESAFCILAQNLTRKTAPQLTGSRFSDVDVFVWEDCAPPCEESCKSRDAGKLCRQRAIISLCILATLAKSIQILTRPQQQDLSHCGSRQLRRARSVFPTHWALKDNEISLARLSVALYLHL